MSSTIEKQNLTEQDERDITATTMLVFLVLIAGIMLGYGWCWYHLGG